MSPVAELVRADIPCSPEAGCVGSIPANSDAQNVPSFRHWRFEMKLTTFLVIRLKVLKEIEMKLVGTGTCWYKRD